MTLSPSLGGKGWHNIGKIRFRNLVVKIWSLSIGKMIVKFRALILGFRESRARKGMVGERASEGWSEEGKREEGELCNLGKRERERMSHRAAYSIPGPGCGKQAVRAGAWIRCDMGFTTVDPPNTS